MIFLECWKLLSGILRVGAVLLEGLITPDLCRPLISSFHSVGGGGRREKQKDGEKDRLDWQFLFFLMLKSEGIKRETLLWNFKKGFKERDGEKARPKDKKVEKLESSRWCFGLITEPKKEWKQSSTGGWVQEPFTSCQSIPVKVLFWWILEHTDREKREKGKRQGFRWSFMPLMWSKSPFVLPKQSYII